MMTARDTDGQRLFSSSEFLTSQQVESYFSRLAAKRALHEQEDIDDVENECQNAADNEEAFSELRSDVLQEVSITHPIYYDCYNLCDLIKNSKLTNFAISVLRKICQHFEIPVADITMRRKAPYIEMIVNFGKNCTCHDDMKDFRKENAEMVNETLRSFPTMLSGMMEMMERQRSEDREFKKFLVKNLKTAHHDSDED
ncbi:hypothetical protein QZH41_015379 [Actinostola sp. cb2023]|nr:hypothetical protein QZH41_015379 [Actinostola sp. cb2023]